MSGGSSVKENPRSIDHCPLCWRKMLVNRERTYYSSLFQAYVREVVYICSHCNIKIVHYDLMY